MKDESGDKSWSMERAMQPKKSMEMKLLKPVPSQFIFNDKSQQVNYSMKKLRHIERKDAVTQGKQDKWT